MRSMRCSPGPPPWRARREPAGGAAHVRTGPAHARRRAGRDPAQARPRHQRRGRRGGRARLAGGARGPCRVGYRRPVAAGSRPGGVAGGTGLAAGARVLALGVPAGCTGRALPRGPAAGAGGRAAVPAALSRVRAQARGAVARARRRRVAGARSGRPGPGTGGTLPARRLGPAAGAGRAKRPGARPAPGHRRPRYRQDHHDRPPARAAGRRRGACRPRTPAHCPGGPDRARRGTDGREPAYRAGAAARRPRHRPRLAGRTACGRQHGPPPARDAAGLHPLPPRRGQSASPRRGRGRRGVDGRPAADVQAGRGGPGRRPPGAAGRPGPAAVGGGRGRAGGDLQHHR